MPDPRETEIAEWLAKLPADERQGAFDRINARIKLTAPIDDVDPPPPVLNLKDYLDFDFPVPPFLVKHGQLVRGEITVMVARAGKGKTTLAQNRLVRWAAGVPLFDEEPESQAPVKPLRILMIENEGSAWHMQEKLALLLNKTAGLSKEQQELARENLLIWGDGGFSGIKLDDDKAYDLVRRALTEHEPDALYMEPFRKLWRGEENSASEMESILDRMVRLGNEFNCGIFLAHHARKTAAEDSDFMTEARGSVNLEDSVAVMEHYKPAKENTMRELAWSKSRYAPPRPPLRMSWDPETWRVTLVPEDAVAAQVMKLMEASPNALFKVAEVGEELDETPGKVRDALTSLVDDERVVKRKAAGQSGYVYRLKTGDEEDEGLSIV